jgi:hypothetical protein
MRPGILSSAGPDASGARPLNADLRLRGRSRVPQVCDPTVLVVAASPQDIFAQISALRSMRVVRHTTGHERRSQ